jgi:Cupin-like domain
MNTMAPPAAIAETHDVVDARVLEDIRRARRPMVMRGLVASWPAVRTSDVLAYLNACGATRPVGPIAAAPSEKGRFFYDQAFTGLNFGSAQMALSEFLAQLAAAAAQQEPPGLALQSEIIAELLPRFAAENVLSLLPQIKARIWIGNRIRVAPHFDLMENIACNVAGRRRFTLFPPEQVGNLYPGPFEVTPAGTPVSMVDPGAPDLDRYPRFAEAWTHACQATLEPGDALYMPYCWWHGVESLEAVSILVNYWWNDDLPGLAGPYDALLHAMLAFRHLPAHEREVWRRMIDYYVFESDGDPGAHLPPHARGVLGPASTQLFARMRAMLRTAL